MVLAIISSLDCIPQQPICMICKSSLPAPLNCEWYRNFYLWMNQKLWIVSGTRSWNCQWVGGSEMTIGDNLLYVSILEALNCQWNIIFEFSIRYNLLLYQSHNLTCSWDSKVYTLPWNPNLNLLQKWINRNLTTFNYDQTNIISLTIQFSTYKRLKVLNRYSKTWKKYILNLPLIIHHRQRYGGYLTSIKNVGSILNTL